MNDFVDMPTFIDADFCLVNTGDSMINARIFDGDTVYIKQQDTVENGEIAAFLFNGEVRLGRFWKGDNHIALVPANPNYESNVFLGEEMSKVRIIGKAVAITGMIK